MLFVNGKYQLNTTVAYGDKSITHRALILASIADAPCTIYNALISDDTLATANCLYTLGAKVYLDHNSFYVEPIKKPNTNVTLDCKNSGTTARLLLGLVCGLGIEAKFVGDNSLSKRPMKRLTDLLCQMGANISYEEGCLFNVHPSTLVGKSFCLSVASAQIKSALIIAGLFASGTTTVVEPAVCRNHTEILLAQMGANITVNNQSISVEKSHLKAMDVTVPNDLSTASFLVVAMLKQGCVLPNVGVNYTRTGFLDVLISSGADITYCNQRVVCGEDVADIVVKPSKLKPLLVSKGDVVRCIDELPLLMTLALTVNGTSTFYGVDELRVKESDRVQSVVDLVRAFGQSITVWQQDGTNVSVNSNGVLKKATVVTFGDHRIAMSALAVAPYSNGVVIDDEDCLAISCPLFLDILGVSPTRLALIGKDVDASLSPRLHMLFAKDVGVNLSYVIKNVSHPEFILKTLFNYHGANVTAPYKGIVGEWFGKPSVNTIGNKRAFSTDGDGVVDALADAGIEVNGKNLLVLGAGGASWSAVESLLLAGAKVNVINRTVEKATNIHKHFGIDYTLDSVDGILSFVPPCNLENTVEIANSVQFVFSAEYKKDSPLIKRAQQLGIKTVDGLSMLFFQGKRSFNIWTGLNPNVGYQQFVEEVKK